MGTKVQFTMHNMFSRPASTYGSEMWALTSQDKKITETFQMRFLRSMLRVTLRDRMRNRDIGNHLETENVVEEIIQ
jgi:hypothetical protein